MKRKEAILHIEKIKEFLTSPKICWGKDDNKIVALDMAIEALTEPINCVKCKHYYETEDDMDVHGYCKMDTAHTNLISKEEAIKMLKALNMMLRSPDGKPISDVCDALDMAIDALQFAKHFDLLKEFQSLQEVVYCKDCKHYEFVDNKAFGMPVKYCDWFGFEDVDDNDFCSRGERKGGDTK